MHPTISTPVSREAVATLPTDEEESEVPMDCRGAISL